MSGKQCVLLLLGVASIVTTAQGHTRNVDNGFFQHRNSGSQNTGRVQSPAATNGLRESLGQSEALTNGGAEQTGRKPNSGGTKGTNDTSTEKPNQEQSAGGQTSGGQVKGQPSKGQNSNGQSSDQQSQGKKEPPRTPPPTPPPPVEVSPTVVVASVLGLGLLLKLLWPRRPKTIREQQLRTLTAPTVIFTTQVEANGADGSRYSGKPSRVEFVLGLKAVPEMGHYTIKREPAVLEGRRER
jgi:hypothetical protein